EPITASTAPTSAVSSSCTLISRTVPATGDGISVSTLSVETSSSGSSASTVSPTCLSQRVMVPSVTLSPSAGILTSVPSPPVDGAAAVGCGAGASASTGFSVEGVVGAGGSGAASACGAAAGAASACGAAAGAGAAASSPSPEMT